ncbi:glycosyltransferase family A protein [Agromyces flavus]|uniref:glycosyltransferase family A protein n=1 Tax=Agromyces flavus TaxID=589382 RepID=UPI003608C88F
MPVHDVADYVDASIRSVLSQGYWRLELIVVDDASEDATLRFESVAGSSAIRGCDWWTPRSAM